MKIFSMHMMHQNSPSCGFFRLTIPQQTQLHKSLCRTWGRKAQAASRALPKGRTGQRGASLTAWDHLTATCEASRLHGVSARRTASPKGHTSASSEQGISTPSYGKVSHSAEVLDTACSERKAEQSSEPSVEGRNLKMQMPLR